MMTTSAKIFFGVLEYSNCCKCKQTMYESNYVNLRNLNEKRQECSVCNSSDDGSEKGVNSRLCFNVVCMITK